MKTELIIYHRPFSNILATPNEPALGLATSSNFVYDLKSNINQPYTKAFQEIKRPSSNSTGGVSLDLYEGVSLPINFTIIDVREPDKIKTNWSKTITIPGTQNNNRIFDHIYELGADGWVTIGQTSVYEGFNPNLRLQCIINTDGVQVTRGNLQLKKITRDYNGNIEYEISITGDLTSLFYDLGTSKLSDLDLSEWNHTWSKDNIEKSWLGESVYNGATFNSIVSSGQKTITKIFGSAQTGRLSFQTSTSHSLTEGTYVKIEPDLAQNANFMQVAGEWQVTDVSSATQFSVNYFYPVGLRTGGYTGTLGTLVRRTASGRGYVYPMISWGDEYDYNSFPVTSFIPGIYIKEIWDKIFKETNSSYTSTFLNSQFFKRLILIQKKSGYELDVEDYKPRKFWVGSTQSFTTGASYLGTSQYFFAQVGTTSTASASIFPSVTPKHFPFESESGGFGTVSFYDNAITASGSYGNWDNTTYKWKVADTGEYDLQASMKLTGFCDMNGFGTTVGTGTASFNTAVYRYYPGSGGEIYTNAFTSGPEPYASIDPYIFGMQVRATIQRLRDGVVTKIGESQVDFKMNNQSFWTPTNENWPYFGRYQPTGWKNQELNVTSTSKYFREGDEVWIELSQIVGAYAGPPGSLAALGRKTSFCFNQSGGPEIARAVVGEWYLTVESQSYIFNSPSPKTVEGGLLSMSNVLPKDMDCKDFLLGIIKMFNLHIEADRGSDKRYTIEPRDDYYYTGSTSSQLVDWSSKLDTTSVEITPMGELIAKYYIFENKEESDYWNQKYKNERGRPYQYYNREINNDFLKNENKITLPFGSTVMINNPEGSDVVIPAIYAREANGSPKPVSNSAPRILIWGGMRPYSAQRGGARIQLQNSYFPNAYGWEILSGSNSTIISASSSIYSQYPYAGTVDSPADPIRDINWYNMEVGDFVYYDNARWTNENLYNKYWSNFINEISDPTSKVINCKLVLTPSDISNLDFRKIYVIDGHWLRLQKVIGYDPIGDGLTECEFLKLKSPTKFKRESVIVDSFGSINNTFANTTDTIRPVSVNFLQVAPSRKRPEFGYNNTISGMNLSNSLTIQTNGLSNFVGPVSKNISITGNENAVGDGCENITISGGSGNFIVGGVKNVNIIGTDKKLVNESNVTYINGVRYVRGVPVSKSNIIDGCVDLAIVRQSASTTPNTIDGSEDVVISAGSAVYENVVNSGQDSILPDLPELGISTVVNPNPRTNLTAGYESGSATQSIIEVIRKRAETR